MRALLTPSAKTIRSTLMSGLSILVLSGCTTFDAIKENDGQIRKLERPVDVRPDAASRGAAGSDPEGLLSTPTKSAKDTTSEPTAFSDRSQTSRIPRIGDSINANAANQGSAPKLPNGMINTVVPPAALPNFIDSVFGGMLGVPYVTGPGVASRTDVVQLRSSGEMEPKIFLELVSMALKDYGVRVTSENGVYQILEDQALKARTPQFIKSRAKISTPANLRPVVQFIELNAIDANDMAGILRQALGRNQEAINIESASDSNFIILSGLPGDIETAIDIIYQMDELDYAGTQVQRYSPAYWNAAQLQQEVRTLLEAEGWQASISASLPKTILMLAVDYSNDLMIFTRSRAARDRVNYWLKELDRPTPQGDVPELFVYDVQNLDAQLLAGTVNQVLSSQNIGASSVARPSNILSGQGLGAGGSFGSQGNALAQGTARANNDNGLPQGGARLVVDTLGNRLIYSGTASDYQRLLPLLRRLDRAPAEVMIEVTIADVTLNDGLSYGVDWSVNNIADPSGSPRTGFRERDQRGAGGSIGSNGENLFDNFSGSVASQAGGVTAVIANSNVRADIQAAANNGDVRILSTPRIFARSGATSQVQVGTDVPVITSQSAANVNVGEGILNLQSVSYRSTGILLSVEPVVFGNNRIDLNISQELSSESAGSAGGVASPTFSNTSVSTSLSLEDGQTAVIAGLIQETADQSNSGIPFLKDIPGLGNLFSSTSFDTSQREIIILITAYVLQGQKDKDAFLNEFTTSFNRTTQNSNLVTLRPRRF